MLKQKINNKIAQKMKERNRIKKYKQMTPLKEIKINDQDFQNIKIK